jgi:hypothetical protein
VPLWREEGFLIWNCSLASPAQSFSSPSFVGRKTIRKFKLLPSVNRPVRLAVRHPSGTRDQFFFLLEIFFRQLRVGYFVVPSLTRVRFCNLLYNCYWALSEQSLLGQSPSELTIIFYSVIWDSTNLEAEVPVFISPRNRLAQLYPGHWIPILSPLTNCRAAVEVSYHASTWVDSWKISGRNIYCANASYHPRDKIVKSAFKTFEISQQKQKCKWSYG